MKSMLCGLMILLSFQSMAQNITCVLTAEGEKSIATIPFKDIDEDGNAFAYSEGAEFDLSFGMEFYCDGDSCDVSLVVDSQILEDEAGSTGFEFNKTQPKGLVHSEPVTHAPDGKNYFLYCYLNK